MNPAMREKLDCVKDHLEDSRAKVDAAEAEMRGVMLNLRKRRRAGAHQRSVGELHELLHGVRIEQQRTQRSLAASQQLGRTARSTALSHILVGTYLRSLRRAWAEWERAAAASPLGGSGAPRLGAASSANAAARARRRTRAAISGGSWALLAPRDNARIPAHCGAPREYIIACRDWLTAATV